MRSHAGSERRMPVSRIDRAFRFPENRRCGMNNQGCNRVVHFNAIELHAITLVDAGAPGILARDTVELVDPLCAQDRSEEHTSELQSLMRISYAVFCLKKKKYITQITTYLCMRCIHTVRTISTHSKTNILH